MQERNKQSQKTIHKALEITPDNAIIHYNLSNKKKYKTEDRQMKDMLHLLKKESCSIEQQGFLHFALGKAYSDLSMYEKSIYHIKCANELWNTKFQFDIEEQKNYFYQCQKLYSDNLLVGKPTPSKKTIFIVGMPRCGSTLVEQILSSHSKVHAMGETDLFSRTVDTMLQIVEVVSNQNHVLESLHEQYIQDGRNLEIDEEYITDKLAV